MLTRNATRFLTDFIFRAEAERYPDVIFSNPMKLWQHPVTGTPDLAEHVANSVRPLAALFPDFWKGKWVVSFYEGPILRWPAYMADDYGDVRIREALGNVFANDHQRSARRGHVGDVLKKAQHHVETTIDRRIQITTPLPFYLPKLDQTDGGDEFTFHSLHHHEVPNVVSPGLSFNLCGYTSGGENRVCGDVVHFLAILLLHIGTASRTAHESPAATPQTSPRDNARPHSARRHGGWANLPATTHPLHLCGDCPASYAPFHIKAIPDPTCTVVSSGLPEHTGVHKVWAANVQPCSQWCLDNVKPRLIPTGSGSVEERMCQLSRDAVLNRTLPS